MIEDIKPTKGLEEKQLAAFNELLTQQISVAWEEARTVLIPKSYKNVQNIVFVGMGGSSLGAHLLKSVYRSEIKVPFEMIRDYDLPNYVNSKSLVVLSSFSGTTEEVLFAMRDAKKRKAKILVISSGGKLAAFAKREKVSGYIFDPGDLAPQPRMGLGFSLVGVLGLLKQVGLVKTMSKDIEKLKAAMDDVIDCCAADVVVKSNPAKKVALALKGKSIMVVAAEHLVGNAHVAQNQINETAKQFAIYEELPEMDHHLLEGLTYPEGLFDKYSVLMLRSSFYDKRIQKRFDVTADLLEKQGGTVVDYNAGGGSRLEEAGELLQFTAYIAGYLAMINKTDPFEIPWVDELKVKMSQR